MGPLSDEEQELRNSLRRFLIDELLASPGISEVRINELASIAASAAATAVRETLGDLDPASESSVSLKIEQGFDAISSQLKTQAEANTADLQDAFSSYESIAPTIAAAVVEELKSLSIQRKAAAAVGPAPVSSEHVDQAQYAADGASANSGARNHSPRPGLWPGWLKWPFGRSSSGRSDQTHQFKPRFDETAAALVEDAPKRKRWSPEIVFLVALCALAGAIWYGGHFKFLRGATTASDEDPAARAVARATSSTETLSVRLPALKDGIAASDPADSPLAKEAADLQVEVGKLEAANARTIDDLALLKLSVSSRESLSPTFNALLTDPAQKLGEEVANADSLERDIRSRKAKLLTERIQIAALGREASLLLKTAQDRLQGLRSHQSDLNDDQWKRFQGLAATLQSSQQQPKDVQGAVRQVTHLQSLVENISALDQEAGIAPADTVVPQ